MISILGISAFYHDSAAALIVDGKIIAAAQEERFTRIKHDSSYPTNAIKFVLQFAKIDLKNIDFNSPRINVETGPYFLGRNLTEDDYVTMLPMDMIYPAGYETNYKSNNLNRCYKYGNNGNQPKLILRGEERSVYLQYPCKQYPKSIMIKHWEVGGTWK